jgi:hypothetical protein
MSSTTGTACHALVTSTAPNNRRALRRRDLAAVNAAAAELQRVPLDDAFAICLLILEQQPIRYERAALRC